MSLKALFVPDVNATVTEPTASLTLALPVAADVPESSEVIQGFYLRDEGYSEAGAVAGRFTYERSHWREVPTVIDLVGFGIERQEA